MVHLLFVMKDENTYGHIETDSSLFLTFHLEETVVWFSGFQQHFVGL